MDENIYSETAVSKFMNKNLFFGDPVLKKYYEQDELKKFRNRINRMYSKESFEKITSNFSVSFHSNKFTFL